VGPVRMKPAEWPRDTAQTASTAHLKGLGRTVTSSPPGRALVALRVRLRRPGSGRHSWTEGSHGSLPTHRDRCIPRACIRWTDVRDADHQFAALINDPFGRPRRRRRWLVPLALASVLLAAVALSQAATPTSPLLAEDIRSAVMPVSRRADVFRDMLARIGSVDRVELQTFTDEAIKRVVGVRDFVAELDDPPGEVVGVLGLLDLAHESWEVGLAGFTSHLLAAADGDGSLGLSDALIDDLLELRAGDRLYREAVSLLASADVTQPVSAMPDVRFLPEGYPLVPAVQTLLAHARVDGSLLALRASLAVEQVTTLPEWVLDTEGTLVVDATEELVVRVVVTNAGNSASAGSALTAEVVGGDGSAQSATLDVPPLAAGAKTTLTYEPLQVTPGRSYSLVVRLALTPGEGQTADNSRTLSFRVNEGSVTTTTAVGG
jgi:hypothetical protein